MKPSIILFCLLTVLKAQCCINEYRALLTGGTVFVDASEHASPGPRFDIEDKEVMQVVLRRAQADYETSQTLENYSDLGAMYVYNGEYLKAKRIFEDIEKQSPGRYQTAANIGTVYELLGQNDSAHYWISKAMEIYPESHGGSEWIHLKILEAKMKANGNDRYLMENNILGLNFGDAKKPELKNDTTLKDLTDIRYDLYIQLNERMTFIKPKDPVVAQLLFDLGNICAITMDVKSALQVYESATRYGYTSAVLDKRRSYFKKLQFLADFRNGDYGPAILFTLALFTLAGVVWLFRKKGAL